MTDVMVTAPDVDLDHEAARYGSDDVVPPADLEAAESEGLEAVTVASLEVLDDGHHPGDVHDGGTDGETGMVGTAPPAATEAVGDARPAEEARETEETADAVTAELAADTPAESSSPRRHRRRRSEEDHTANAVFRAPTVGLEAAKDDIETSDHELDASMVPAEAVIADETTSDDRIQPDTSAFDASEEADTIAPPDADLAPDVDVVSVKVVDESAPGDDPDEASWRERWPDNEVRMVARLLPRISDAPALDGVQRSRMEISLVEQHAGEFGTVGTLPIFVMPGASGLATISNEIKRAARQKRRLDPIMVELRGSLRQLPDRDFRYVNARYSVLMAVEVHAIKQVASGTEQYAFWRGRATVSDIRRYEHKGLPYQRVTAVVAVWQHKPHLRGLSLMHVPVDFLVAPEHPHASRFERIGQRLLIEGNIGGDVHRMSDNHPALEGLEPQRKAQLQVLRESVVTVAMGEFPDDAAEQDHDAWVRAGRPPRPLRQPRKSRIDVAQRVSEAPAAEETNGHAPTTELRRPDRPRREHAPSGNGQTRSQIALREPRTGAARTKGTSEPPG